MVLPRPVVYLVGSVLYGCSLAVSYGLEGVGLSSAAPPGPPPWWWGSSRISWSAYSLSAAAEDAGPAQRGPAPPPASDWAQCDADAAAPTPVGAEALQQANEQIGHTLGAALLMMVVLLLTVLAMRQAQPPAPAQLPIRTRDAETQTNGQTVYVSPGGKCWHSMQCPRLSRTSSIRQLRTCRFCPW
jgi:hypothetical protein